MYNVCLSLRGTTAGPAGTHPRSFCGSWTQSNPNKIQIVLGGEMKRDDVEHFFFRGAKPKKLARLVTITPLLLALLKTAVGEY